MDLGEIGALGVAGCAVVVATSLVAVIAYRGVHGERFSPLNHFISELGEIGVSRLARLFNAGLIAGGALLVPFFLLLGLALSGIPAKVSIAAGVAAAVSLAFVGVFPLNRIGRHRVVAVAFFRAGLAAVLLDVLTMWTQPVAPAPAAIDVVGLVAVASYALFLILIATRVKQGAGAASAIHLLAERARIDRPRFWSIPAVEWLVFISTIGWCISLGMTVR